MFARRPRAVALVGMGTIGEAILEQFEQKALPGFRLSIACQRRHNAQMQARVARMGGVYTQTLDAVRDSSADIVVECASQDAAKALIPAILAQGKVLVLSSIGALAEDALRANLDQLVKRYGGQVLLPSGALGGLDLIAALKIHGIHKMLLVTTKPGYALGRPMVDGSEPEVIFRGSAKEAAAHYPQNMNIAATLALAGPGMEKVDVEVRASSSSQVNTHEVFIDAVDGHYRLEFTHLPSRSNPKTSAVVASSVIALLRNLDAPVRMG